MGNETKAVRVGGVWMGAGAPISVQSMTNTYTGDVEATTAQVRQLAEAGCEIVRMAVNDVPAAAAVREIRARTRVPLVADIHFDYRLAIASIENGIDKIRFNPGNIGSEANVRALVDCAKAHHVPIRIGVNAGSLDKALLARYGAPVPAALAESALSHVRILERAGFSDIVISAKISSVPETVETYRLLKQACSYPLHIGVTEAGGGELALIKSAVGIGALLLEGIGDTIRVSLTGDPVREVVAGKAILQALGLRRKKLLYSYVLLFDAKFFYRYTPVLFPHARRYEKEGRIHVSEKACRSCRCRSSRSRGKARTQDRKVRCQNGESPQNGKDRPQGPSPAFP